MDRERDTESAMRFLEKALDSCHRTKPIVITSDCNKDYPITMQKLKNSIPFGMLFCEKY